MKQIKENKTLYEVSIDEQNVMEDAVLDLLFDDSRYLQEKKEAVGFICGYPAYARIRGNAVEIAACGISKLAFCYHRTFINTIVERITGNDYKNIYPDLVPTGYVSYLDEDSKLAAVFSLKSDILRLEYYLAE